MTNPNLPNDFQPEEIPTSLRFSLAFEAIGSRDFMLQHVSGSVRLVSYEASDEDTNQLQSDLISRDMVLGKVISDVSNPEQTFRIPEQARPLTHDAPTKAQDSLSYDDHQLFYDLGLLLGSLYEMNDKGYVLDADVGHSVSFVEFTREAEKRLYFAPGVEKVIKTINNDIDPIGYYAEKLGESFNDRFYNATIDFRMGFSEGK